MSSVVRVSKPDYYLLIAIFFLVTFSVLVLNSIAPSLFPVYYLYIALALLFFIIFLQIDFEILSVFYNHMYILGVFFLVLPLIIGQVTRGAIRWIPIGPLTIQPSEIDRPFLLIFFANYLTKDEITAMQLDTKNGGIDIAIFEETIELAHKQIKKILQAMNKEIKKPNAINAIPVTMKIDSSKVRLLSYSFPTL